jgi:hypothetical protein
MDESGSWHNYRHHPGICLEGRRRAMTNLRINGPLAEFGNRDLPKIGQRPADLGANKDVHTKHKFRLLVKVSAFTV